MSETKKHLKTVVMDVGSLKKRRIRELKAGVGKHADEARTAAEGIGIAANTVVPIVIVYERRPRKRRGLLGGLLRKL
jgi:hypothetical protein